MVVRSQHTHFGREWFRLMFETLVKAWHCSIDRHLRGASSAISGLSFIVYQRWRYQLYFFAPRCSARQI